MKGKRLFPGALVFFFVLAGLWAPAAVPATGKIPDEIPQPFLLEDFVGKWNLADSRWILIEKSRFTLIEYLGTRELARFDVALGKNPGDKQRVGDMRTPEGVFRVVSIHDSRHWVHDFGDGEGPVSGAYGPWFIRLETGWKGIGIHGTHDPGSIGTRASEGCIRMRNGDLLQVVDETSPGTVVVIKP
ncbi:MAG: L,D-transpeptidase [Thermovirgaceae bacterium]